MPDNKDFIRICHILDAIEEIENYSNGILYENFQDESMRINATIRQLEIIGEASNHLSAYIKEKYTTIEWRQIIGFRNMLIHEYFSVDITIVWHVINYDLPNLKETITEIKNDLKT